MRNCIQNKTHAFEEVTENWYQCEHCSELLDYSEFIEYEKKLENLKKYENFLEDSFGTWREPLKLILNNSYFRSLGRLPKRKQMFNAFKYCDYENTKVIILGTKPYSNEHYDNGLAFGTDFKFLPTELVEIKKALFEEYGTSHLFDHSLRSLAEQGVLLLNTSLSHPYTHLWNKFIKYVIFKAKTNIIMAWGDEACSLARTTKKTIVLPAGYPSSSVYGLKRFDVHGDFKKVNELLLKNNKKPINWTINRNVLEHGL